MCDPRAICLTTSDESVLRVMYAGGWDGREFSGRFRCFDGAWRVLTPKSSAELTLTTLRTDTGMALGAQEPTRARLSVMPSPTLPAINRAPKLNNALHPDRSWIRLLRLVIGGLALASVVYNAWRSATGASDHTLIQTLSHFTNVSNALFGLVCVVGAVSMRKKLPVWWDDLRGMLTFMMVMTGIIYAVLVAEPGEFTRWDLPWHNIVAHRVAPVAALLGWLLITTTRRARWWRSLVWLLLPIAWLAYTWIRGAIAGWYPYKFLDPTLDGGWGRVMSMMGYVVIAFLAVSLILHLLGNLRAWLAHRDHR